MKTAILLQKLDLQVSQTLGGVLIKARVQKFIQEFMDETYGSEGVDWSLEVDNYTGIYVKFACPKQAVRFKLAWDPQNQM